MAASGSPVKVGSLFSGYGGLDLAVSSVLDAEVVWHCEVDRSASKILARRWPDVPNLGDITAVDWSQVEPIDVLTGGFPCQDVSSAGKRAGLKPGTRSGLWSHMAYAIDQLRPRLVVVENVRGLLSAEAHSDMEPCPWCLGDGEDKSALRALGAVLGDLAELGYDAGWRGVRASDIGAPHGRFRVFVAAFDARHPNGEHVGAVEAVQDACTESVRAGAAPTNPDGTRYTAGRGRQAGSTITVDRVREAPATNTVGDAQLVEVEGVGTAEARPGSDGQLVYRAGHAGLDDPRSDARDVAPDSHDDGCQGSEERDRGQVARLDSAQRDHADGCVVWGPYEPAITRWEQYTGRSAPDPTEPATNGGRRLSPRFVEWLMGLPDGWVTAVPDISRHDRLKALGNGVVPQQAALALALLLADREAA